MGKNLLVETKKLGMKTKALTRFLRVDPKIINLKIIAERNSHLENPVSRKKQKTLLEKLFKRNVAKCLEWNENMQIDPQRRGIMIFSRASHPSPLFRHPLICTSVDNPQNVFYPDYLLSNVRHVGGSVMIC